MIYYHLIELSDNLIKVNYSISSHYEYYFHMIFVVYISTYTLPLFFAGCGDIILGGYHHRNW
jgi:hypothetical protein